MTPASKFSLILMHDDGRTHRMRVSRNLFRLLVALLVLSPLLGILGLWVGFEAWRTMSNWQQERVGYQIKIDDMRVQLERLSTLEALLKTEKGENGLRGPALANAGTLPTVASTSAPGQAAGAASSSSAASSSGSPPNAGNQAGPGALNLAAATAVASSNPAQKNGEKEPAESAVPPALSPDASGADNSDAEAQPDEQRRAVNLGKIRVENMQARIIDRRRLRVSVDLYNAEAKGRQLGGKTIFSLLTADGRQFPLSNEDAAFRISRFKKVVTTSTLPVPVSELDNAAIVVEVNVDGKLVYRNLFSIETR